MTTVLMSAEEVRQAVSMPDAISALREAFLGLGNDEFELPQRTVLGGGSFLSMSVHHRPTRSAVVKSISADFQRRPAIVGALVWVSASGANTLVADAATVTALRTGAVSGLATDLLAAPDAHRLVLVGVGGQAADQLRAVRAVRPIDTVTVVATEVRNADAFCDRLGEELAGLSVQTSDDLEPALGDADVICCVTPATEPLFRLEALPARVHVNAIGSYRLNMRELPDSLLGTATVVVDQLEAALEESGEINHAIEAGELDVNDLVELSHALAHTPPLRDRTVFKSVGIAIQDWAIGHALANGAFGA